MMLTDILVVGLQLFRFLSNNYLQLLFLQGEPVLQEFANGVTGNNTSLQQKKQTKETRDVFDLKTCLDYVQLGNGIFCDLQPF